jgi:hypothetical protein
MYLTRSREYNNTSYHPGFEFDSTATKPSLPVPITDICICMEIVLPHHHHINIQTSNYIHYSQQSTKAYVSRENIKLIDRRTLWSLISLYRSGKTQLSCPHEPAKTRARFPDRTHIPNSTSTRLIYCIQLELPHN